MLRFFEERHGLEIRSSLFFSYQKTLDFFKLEKPRVQTIWRVLITVEMMKLFDVLFDLFHGLFLVLENVSSMIGFVKSF